ncbi:MAG: radical SAM protein, partial [Candidatus Paceibacteria bacterium]
PRGGNFEMTVEAAREAGQTELAEQLEELQCRERWTEYSRNHLSWVQKIGKELGLPIHLWPDKQLIKTVGNKEKEWLQDWRDRQSPEQFAMRELPDDSMPLIPAVQRVTV